MLVLLPFCLILVQLNTVTINQQAQPVTSREEVSRVQKKLSRAISAVFPNQDVNIKSPKSTTLSMIDYHEKYSPFLNKLLEINDLYSVYLIDNI